MNSLKFIKILTIFILVLFFSLPNFKSYAEENLENICVLEKIDEQCDNVSQQECQKLLEKCEAYYEEKTLQIEGDIANVKQKEKNYENQIYLLRSKINQLNSQVYQSNLIIKDLGIQITDTDSSIVTTSSKVEEAKANLKKILRSIDEEDKKSLVEILISEDNFSDFFNNLMALEVLSSETQELLGQIKGLKLNLENQKESLNEEKTDLEGVVRAKSLQQQESDRLKKEQEHLLRLTETEYKQYVKEKEEIEKGAAEIRARIYEMIGTAEVATFGEAYEIAKYVESVTGVRPALLLAVLTQESNIGKNVGQCFLRNSSTGSGVIVSSGKSISRVMKPSRDVGPFLTITKELGRDPYNTLVSCPMSYGYGGAMGPAQFIPSTWMIYRDELKEKTGKAADPWDIKDAFLAAGLYLSKYGATKQTYENEFSAALCYFAGPGWYKSRYKNVYKRDYGYPVMRLAENYGDDIAELEK